MEELKPEEYEPEWPDPEEYEYDLDTSDLKESEPEESDPEGFEPREPNRMSPKYMPSYELNGRRPAGYFNSSTSKSTNRWSTGKWSSTRMKTSRTSTSRITHCKSFERPSRTGSRGATFHHQSKSGYCGCRTPTPIRNQGYENQPPWEGQNYRESFECNRRRVHKRLRVRTSYHREGCPPDGITCILRKDDHHQSKPAAEPPEMLDIIRVQSA